MSDEALLIIGQMGVYAVFFCCLIITGLYFSPKSKKRSLLIAGLTGVIVSIVIYLITFGNEMQATYDRNNKPSTTTFMGKSTTGEKKKTDYVFLSPIDSITAVIIGGEPETRDTFYLYIPPVQVDRSLIFKYWKWEKSH